MDLFLKHQKVIFRSLGAFMLLMGFVIHFWYAPRAVVSQNKIAAANVARMEASVEGKASKKAKPDTSTISKALKATKEKQMQYMTIFTMIFGVLFLAYSFLKKEEP